MTKVLISSVVLLLFLFSSASVFAEELRVMPVGDSLTVGVGGGYRYYLKDKLQKSNIKIKYVGEVNVRNSNKAHTAYVGKRVSYIRRVLPSAIIKHRPDLILLMIGTNDVASGISPRKYAKELLSLLEEVWELDPDIKVFLSELPKLKNQNHLVRHFNKNIRGIVEILRERKYPIFLVQGANEIPKSYFVDGVHLSRVGYRKLALYWYETITSNKHLYSCIFLN